MVLLAGFDHENDFVIGEFSRVALCVVIVVVLIEQKLCCTVIFIALIVGRETELTDVLQTRVGRVEHELRELNEEKCRRGL